MKILLIQPKMNKRPMDTDLKTRMAPSLALLTLTRLTPVDHEVVIVNENIERIDFSCAVDLVAITVTLDVLPRAREIAAIFQTCGIPVVAGGIHVTCSPDDCLSYFDAICIGAAERVWLQMVEDAAKKSLQKVYHDMKGFRGDEIVSPQYDKIDRKRYLFSNVISTSRGCPNSCYFCYNSCKNRLYVYRPIQAVLSDIKALKTRYVLFIDDNFIGAPEHTRALLQAIKPLKLKWSAAVTTEILDHPDLLDLMAETGCQSLFIGFESLNDIALQGVNKNNRFQKYEKLAYEIHHRGIMINASIVLGLDGDGPEVFAKTLAWLEKNRIETLTSHILTPYPGTVLYDQMKAAGRIVDDDLSKYNTSHVVYRPQRMDPEKLHDGYLWMYRRFYSFSSIIRRMPEQEEQRKSYFMFNLFYRKFGRLTSALSRIVLMGMIGRVAAWISYHIR